MHRATLIVLTNCYKGFSRYTHYNVQRSKFDWVRDGRVRTI